MPVGTVGLPAQVEGRSSAALIECPLAAAIEAWWPAIEAAVLIGYSNARAGGYNRLAKHQQRNAFGFSNSANRCRRIRFAGTRQHRRASAVGSTSSAGV